MEKENPTLWQLTELVKELATEIGLIEDDDDLEGIKKDQLLEQKFNEWLAAGDDFDEKALAVAEYINHEQAVLKARQDEYRRLRTLAQQSERKIEKTRQYLVTQMTLADKPKIEGTKHKISLRKKPARVILDCPLDEVPPTYLKTEITLRKREVAKMLKEQEDGETCEWASFSTIPEYSVTIK